VGDARLVRVVLLLVLTAFILPGAATPAAAHAGGLSSSTSEARVLALDPPVPGLDVRAVEFGARLRLANGTGTPVVVPPGPDAVALPAVEPGGVAYWFDPRVTAAAAAPRPDGDRLAWTVPLRVGDATVTVRGEQYWPPPPATALWTVLAVLALAVPAVAGVLGAARPWGRVVLACATFAVLAAPLTHVLGSAGVPEDQPYALMLLSAAGYAMLGWPLGAVGAWLTLRGHSAGPLFCVAAGGLFAIVIAPVDAFTLFEAVVPFSWGADLDRALVALTLGGGLGVVVAGVAVLRRGPVSAAQGPAA
jgi:hypothetical protein